MFTGLSAFPLTPFTADKPDEAAVLAGKNNPQHQAAQREGRETLFAGYSLRIATLVREYASKPETN